MTELEQLLAEWLDIPENMNRLRALAKKELKTAYDNNPQSGYNRYDESKLDRDSVWFWNVWGDTSNHIQYNRATWTLYDDRIEGRIDFSSPNNILNTINNRVVAAEASWNIAFIMKDQNWVDVFIYYEAWILKYVFPTTIWNGNSTPSTMIVWWNTNFWDRKLANYYNIKNRDGSRSKWPMPYSRRLSTLEQDLSEQYGGINTHIWTVWPWNSSHWCARQGGLGAVLLFHTMKDRTVVYRTNQRLKKEIK